METAHKHLSTDTHQNKVSSEEVIALLSYMIEHNHHHEEELHELSLGMKPEASLLIHEAIDLFQAGNKTLSRALEKVSADMMEE